MMEYRTLFIDWDGTLSNSRFWDRWVGSDRYNLLQRVLFAEGREYVQLWMTGDLSHSQILRYVESKTGLPYEDLLRELRYSAEHMSFIDQKIPTLIHTLRRNGTRVILATDNMDTFNLWTIPAPKLDTLFDGFLISTTKKSLKTHVNPDGSSAFFHNYLTENQLAPHGSILLDNSADTEIVRQFGIDFMLVTEQQTIVSHLQKLIEGQSTHTAEP